MAAVTQQQTTPVQNAPAAKQEVRGGLVLFWLVAGIAFGKDILDIFVSMLDLVGIGLQLIPVVGNIAGIAIAFIATGIDFMTSMVVNFTMLAYFAYTGGKLGRRFALMSIVAIIDMIPGLNALLLTTLTFFLAYLIGKYAPLDKITQVTNAAHLKT